MHCDLQFPENLSKRKDIDFSVTHPMFMIYNFRKIHRYVGMNWVVGVRPIVRMWNLTLRGEGMLSVVGWAS